FHADWWMHNVAEPLGGGKFKAFNAASTAGAALQGHLITDALYAVGVLSCVFHLANGIWTFGITWGLWVTPQAQQRANYACVAFGILLGIVGLSALGGFAAKVDIEEAKKVEDQMFKSKLASGEVTEDKHKRSEPKEEAKETADAIANPPAKTGE
ncbi:MAG: hypothetical protein K8R36_18495, partial [Planctomycetales bacterium]|nr:hypothetical protein [Planctomycetales bacterium]